MPKGAVPEIYTTRQTLITPLYETRCLRLRLPCQPRPFLIQTAGREKLPLLSATPDRKKTPSLVVITTEAFGEA